jgi:hypothetical protein
MTWGQIDDGLHGHPKADKAGVEAMGLWALALSYCCDQLTDGFVTPERVTRIAGSKPVGVKLAAKLVKAKLWHGAADSCDNPACQPASKGEEGYRFHKWSAYQRLRADVEADRARKVDAGRKGGLRKAANLAAPLAGASAMLPEARYPYPSPILGDPEGGSGSPPAPADDLLRFLADAAADGHPWCTKIQAELLSQGGRLTPPQKVALKKIRVELGALTASAPMPADAPAPPRRNVAPPAPAPVAGPVPILFHAPISSSEGAE